MPHSIVYNGKPIEELSKQELILALESVCAQLENWKTSSEWWMNKCKREGEVTPPD